MDLFNVFFLFYLAVASTVVFILLLFLVVFPLGLEENMYQATMTYIPKTEQKKLLPSFIWYSLVSAIIYSAIIFIVNRYFVDVHSLIGAISVIIFMVFLSRRHENHFPIDSFVVFVGMVVTFIYLGGFWSSLVFFLFFTALSFFTHNFLFLIYMKTQLPDFGVDEIIEKLQENIKDIEGETERIEIKKEKTDGDFKKEQDTQ